jgi:hypothetical protein
LPSTFLYTYLLLLNQSIKQAGSSAGDLNE